MKLTRVQELEAAIREHPATAELYLQIVPLYLESGRDYEAEKLLSKGAAETKDPRVMDQCEELALARLQRSVDAAEEWCARSNSPEAQTALAAANTARQRGELAIFTSRCQRKPGDANAHFLLGRSLFANAQIAEAIEAFGLAMADDAVRAGAALARAECHQRLGQVTEALRFFRLATAAARQPSQMDLKKQSLSQAVQLAKQLKLPKLTIRYARELAAVDQNLAVSALHTDQTALQLENLTV